MALRIGIVAEADRDARIAFELASRQLQAVMECLGLPVGEYVPCGLTDDQPYLKWAAVPREARRAKATAAGHFGGKPGQPDARAARLALLLFADLETRPDVVILFRDTDDQTERLDGLTQAREYRRWPFRVILGLAHAKIESWLLAGYEPQNAAEIAKLNAEKARLGFDPSACSELLTARSKGAKRSAKDCLSELASDPQRVERWIVDRPIFSPISASVTSAIFLVETRPHRRS